MTRQGGGRIRESLDLRDGRLLSELLGRPPRSLPGEPETARAGDERVLVTGAGGSVGSELVRQLAARRPGSLVLVDQSEYALFRIEQEMIERCPGVAVEPDPRRRHPGAADAGAVRADAADGGVPRGGVQTRGDDGARRAVRGARQCVRQRSWSRGWRRSTAPASC